MRSVQKSNFALNLSSSPVSVSHLWLWHIAFETQAATIPMGQCLFPRLFALRHTHDFEADLAIILSNNLAFKPHT